MSSKKETATTAAIKTEKRPRRRPGTPTNYPAAEKVQAVLAVWTDRVKPAEVMRGLGISYLTLQQWQERAMEGMLQALESRVNLTDGAALSPRLKALLQKRQLAAGREKLSARLERLQGVAPAAEPPLNG
jgi:transposase-like protein